MQGKKKLGFKSVLDVMSDFLGVHPNPFDIISDSPSLTAEFERLFNDLAFHYSSNFPPKSDAEEAKFSFHVYPETNFNVRIAEALFSLLTFSEKRNYGWNGTDLATYFTSLLDDIFSLDDEGGSLFPCIDDIKEESQLRSGQPFILFSVTYIDADLEGKRGFVVCLQALHLPR